MILDQVFRALGCSWVYPCKQLLLCNLVLLLCVHNLQKVPLLSWSPEIFCAHKNSSGIYPYNTSSVGPVFYPLSEKCSKHSDGSLNNCTVSTWMEKNPQKPICSPFAVQEFPRCGFKNSILVYEAKKDYSTVTTFNSVCSRAMDVRLQDAFYFIGSAVAFFSCVPLGDIVGRKPIILNMCICFGILNVIMALSKSVELLITCRFLSGMCYATVTGLVSVLMYELNPPQKRMAVAVIGQFSATAGQMLLGFTSYIMPVWRWWLGFEAVAAFVVAILVTAVPESVRWLLIVHRYDPEMNEDCEINARKVVKGILKKRMSSKSPPQNIAELKTIHDTLNCPGTLEVGSFATLDFNENLELRGSESTILAGNLNARKVDGNLLTPDARDKKTKEDSRKVSFRSRTKIRNKGKKTEPEVVNIFGDDLDHGISETLSGESEQNIHTVKKQMTPVLWRCLFVIMLMRTVVNVIYYALALSSNVLFTDGSRHLNMFYMGLIEVPVGPFCYYLNNKVPRRVGLSIMFLLTGVPFLIMGIWNFLQADLPIAARYVFFLMGKSTATACVLMVSLYMAEVFPTTVRTTFSGICSGVARICSTFSTLAPSVFKNYNAQLVTVLSGLAFICAGLIWLLPETKDRKLPQTPSDLQTIHLETKSLAETLRSRRASTTSKMGRSFVSDGVGGAGGLGESGVLDEPGADVPLPSVAYFTPSTQAIDRALQGKLKKPRKLGVIKE